MRYVMALMAYGFTGASMASNAMKTAVVGQGELVRVVTGLLLVLLLIVLLAWVVKRLHGVNFGVTKGFQSIAAMPLGPKERIVLIHAGDRYLLLGVAHACVNLLYDFGTQLPEGFDPTNKPSFAQLLKSSLGKTSNEQ